MAWKNIFLIFSKNEDEKELKEKLASLEMNLDDLKKRLMEFEQKTQKEFVQKTQPAGKEKDPPIIIEKINIEKIILDKYELNNNFGQLGIKELKGKLNIGATYGSEFTPNLKEEDEENIRDSPKESIKNRSTRPKSGPKVNIQAKTEE